MKTDRSLKDNYKLLVKQYKTAVKNHLKSTEENVVKSKNKNLFHSYVKRKLKSSSYLPPLFKSNGTIILDPEEKANTLNNLFSSIFTQDSGAQVPNLAPWKCEVNNMDTFRITRKEVIDAILSLKNTVSGTPDGIPCMFFKQT